MDREERKKIVNRFERTKFGKKLKVWLFISTILLFASLAGLIINFCNEIFNFTVNEFLLGFAKFEDIFFWCGIAIWLYYLGAVECYISFSKNK